MDQFQTVVLVIGLVIHLSTIVAFFMILERRLTKIETMQTKVFEIQIRSLFKKVDILNENLNKLLSRSYQHRKDDELQD